MDDDFDNGMGLPEDDQAGGSAMSDPADLGLGGMEVEDELGSEAPGRPSGGARARRSSGFRPLRRAATPSAARRAKKSPRKSPKRSAKRKSAAKGPKKSARKSLRGASRKPARKGSKKASRSKKAGRRR